MPTLLRWMAAATGAVGVIFAFVQKTDPTPQLTYFTVDSAILYSASATLRTASSRLRWTIPMCDAARVGTLLSGLIWITILTPHGPFLATDDLKVKIANALMHMALPLAAAAEFLTSTRDTEPDGRKVLTWLAWPVAYCSRWKGRTL